jgi:hypothetical protein
MGTGPLGLQPDGTGGREHGWLRSAGAVSSLRNRSRPGVRLQLHTLLVDTFSTVLEHWIHMNMP